MRKITRKIKRYYLDTKQRIRDRITQKINEKRELIIRRWYETSDMRTITYWREWSRPHILRAIELYKMSLLFGIETFKRVRAIDFQKETSLLWERGKGSVNAVRVEWKDRILSANPYVITSFAMCFVIISAASIQIYRSSNSIYDQISERGPASLPAPLLKNPRPAYHKLYQRQFDVESVTIPVYIESVNSVKTMIVDFSANTSNQYISSFFLKHEFYVKDHLNTTLQPIVPRFPLTTEGKRILRTKIKDELNALVKRLNMKGEVLDVSLVGIIAS
jgi:hypothetical protein